MHDLLIWVRARADAYSHQAKQQPQLQICSFMVCIQHGTMKHMPK